MANPTSGWDGIPVFGVWQKPIDQSPEPGKVLLELSQRIQRTDGRIIYPGGAVLSVTIGSTDDQDATIRSVVRAAWRAQDETALGEDFDGTDWDTWWDTKIVPAAVFVRFPAADDPDIVHPEDVEADGYKVKVTEQLTSGKGKPYYIQPLLAHLDLPIPGINLGLLEVPPGTPNVPAPVYAKGLAGGVASLDADGKVPLEQLPAGEFGGIPEGSDLDEIVDSATRLALTPDERGKIADLPAASDLAVALAAKALDTDVIHTTGAETKAGVLTFGAFPLLPAVDPATDLQAVPKGYMDATVEAVTARAAATIAAAGNTNVAAAARNRALAVDLTVSAFAGTATVTLQSTNAQAGDQRTLRVAAAAGAGTVEFRSLSSGGTLLGTIPANASGGALGYRVFSTYTGSAWTPAAIIPEDLVAALAARPLDTDVATALGLKADLSSGKVPISQLPAGSTITTSVHTARPTSRTDIYVIFLTASDPSAVQLSTDIWLRIAS